MSDSDASRPSAIASDGPDAAGKHASGAPWRNFYGRFKGKTLKPNQVRDLDEMLPELSPGAVGWDENPEREPLDLEAQFQGRDVWLEVGFGGGEHLVHQAENNPDVGIIGAEPYVNGVAMLLGKLRKSSAENVRVHAGDARDLMDVLPAQSLSRAFLLYPDPWPKARHHRRRFVTQEHLEPLARVLKPGAIFAWLPIFRTMCARPLKRCQRRASSGLPKAPRIGESLGVTGSPPDTSKRRCARGARRIT